MYTIHSSLIDLIYLGLNAGVKVQTMEWPQNFPLSKVFYLKDIAFCLFKNNFDLVYPYLDVFLDDKVRSYNKLS